ncbi:mitochondrial biogenesis AIM24-domain-containing protein, partial [Lipomyces japonicus]|uniref:mitochondrial biogenesis AIM24-domain-containing protein n=1 Tax=Lipomyces japonicus TaxID=56871 RepID=UPI0034CDEA17
FEAIGTPSSLLNVSLPASATLFTRRGTLLGINGKLDNVTSTLSVLSPTVRALVGIPFLYQKITSTTPLTALITSKSSTLTTFAVVSLDGRVDWTIAQRNSLLAWSGSTLTVKPKLVPHLSLSRWGNTLLQGRGEVALAGKGQIYQITLQEREEFVVHPSNILAFTSNLPSPKPAPYRLRHSRLRLQVPDSILPSKLFDSKFLRDLKATKFVQLISKFFYRFKILIRNSIWGENLFVRFSGPSTILIQSRSAKLADLIPASELREIAQLQPEAFAPRSRSDVNAATETGVVEVQEIAAVEPTKPAQASNGGHLKVASVEDGKVVFKSVDSFKEFIK